MAIYSPISVLPQSNEIFCWWIGCTTDCPIPWLTIQKGVYPLINGSCPDRRCNDGVCGLIKAPWLEGLTPLSDLVFAPIVAKHADCGARQGRYHLSALSKAFVAKACRPAATAASCVDPVRWIVLLK